MLEKRKLKRRQLIYYLKVMDGKTNQLLGRLADITSEGLMLISEKTIETERNFHLDLLLPTGMRGGRMINIEARSLWSKRDVNPDLIDTGFRFIKISPQDLETIDELIMDYELPN
jgi:c-di-GMP-binding flagellar brake protein YcgR